jgi:jumonji domain-containing protein 7
MGISDFLTRLQMKRSDISPQTDEVVYLQSQDGNIYRSEPRYEGWEGPELKPLQAFVKRDVDWMHEALGT